MYWELWCCGGKSHILTIQHRISKIAENSLVKSGIWLPYNSSLSRPMQPRQTYSPGFTNGRTDKELRQAINPSAAMLRSGLKTDSSLSYIYVSTRASIHYRSRAPFTNMEESLIPTWIGNHMPAKVWDEITYPCLNFNGCAVEVCEWIVNFIPHVIMDAINYLGWI